MTTKQLTALAREAFGPNAKAIYYRAPRGPAHEYEAHGYQYRHLVVRGDTRAEAEARFVACLRAIAEVRS